LFFILGNISTTFAGVFESNSTSRMIAAQNLCSRMVARADKVGHFFRAPTGVSTLPRSSQVVHYRTGQYDENQQGPEDFDTAERMQKVQTGIVFAPSAEVQRRLPNLESISKPGPSGVPRVSIGRMDFATKSETAINEQIAVELNMSYLYLSAAAYFGRDNVGLPGFAAFFKHQSDEERTHALRLIEFQARRGGRVMLAALAPPQSDFEHDEKGDALHAAEIALSLEKLNFSRLRELHSMADEADDADFAHFVEDYLLDEQSRDVKEAAVLVSQLQRVGKGLGVFQVDYALQRKYNVQGAGAAMDAAITGEGGDGANTNGIAVSPLL